MVVITVKEDVKVSFAEKATNEASNTGDDEANSVLDDSGQQRADNITSEQLLKFDRK